MRSFTLTNNHSKTSYCKSARVTQHRRVLSPHFCPFAHPFAFPAWRRDLRIGIPRDTTSWCNQHPGQQRKYRIGFQLWLTNKFPLPNAPCDPCHLGGCLVPPMAARVAQQEGCLAVSSHTEGKAPSHHVAMLQLQDCSGWHRFRQVSQVQAALSNLLQMPWS